MAERVWFKIGEAARQVGATPKELRYWEKVIPELQPRRSKGNLRYYHLDELPRLRRIRTWLAEGLPLAECRERLRLEPPPPSHQHGIHPQPPSLPPGALAPIAEALRRLLERLGGPPSRPPQEGRRSPSKPAIPSETKTPPSPNGIPGRLPFDLED